MTKSIDTNVSGKMPNGDPAPKRNPKDGGKKIKIGTGLVIVGAATRVVVEGINPDPTRDAYDAHTDKIERKTESPSNIWERFIDWVKSK